MEGEGWCWLRVSNHGTAWEGGARTGHGQGSPSFLKGAGFLVVAPTGIGDTSIGKPGWAKVVLG